MRVGLNRLHGALSRRSRAALICLFAVVLGVVGAEAFPASAAKEGVLSVRFGGDQTETRVVIELDKAAKGRVITGGGDTSRMLTLALGDVGATSDLQGHGQGLVSAWKAEKTMGDARLHLQLTRPVLVRRRFLLPPSEGVSVYRYVIDLESVASSAPRASVQAAPAATHPAAPAPTLIPAAAETAPIHLKKVVVIDAGHGGHDPGAAGADSREKDVTLAAARALKAALERGGRYKVVMTRDSDTYVPLETRVQIARRADADLFISLHADSGSDPGLRGATVYTLSDKGSERTARGVMDSSNWFINVDLPGQTRAVNQILLDLTQRATRNRSAAFAEDLLGHIGERVQPHASHRDASYMVLLAPDVPAVLLEMGFITNPDDERLLNSPAKRDRFMAEVADSIDAYFHKETQLALR